MVEDSYTHCMQDTMLYTLVKMRLISPHTERNIRAKSERTELLTENSADKIIYPGSIDHLPAKSERIQDKKGEVP